MGGQKEILEAQVEWSRKLSEQMDTLIALQRDIKGILAQSMEKQMPPEYCKSLESNVRRMKDEVCTYIEKYAEEKNKSILLNETYKYKKTISKDWSRCLNARKIAYYNKIRSTGLAEIYTSFLEREPAFIPRKLREKTIPGQSEEQTKLKMELSKKKLGIEISRLQEQVVKQESIITEKERLLETFIMKNTNVHIQQTLKELWLKATMAEEHKSNNIWSNHKKWFEKLPDMPEEPNQATDPTARPPFRQGAFKQSKFKGRNWPQSKPTYNDRREKNNGGFQGPMRYSDAVKFGNKQKPKTGQHSSWRKPNQRAGFRKQWRKPATENQASGQQREQFRGHNNSWKRTNNTRQERPNHTANIRQQSQDERRRPFLDKGFNNKFKKKPWNRK